MLVHLASSQVTLTHALVAAVTRLRPPSKAVAQRNPQQNFLSSGPFQGPFDDVAD